MLEPVIDNAASRPRLDQAATSVLFKPIAARCFERTSLNRVIPGTTDVELDAYPLRVFLGQVQKPGEQPKDTDLLIDQIKAVSNDRFMGDGPLTTLSTNHMKKVESALKTLLSL